MAASAPFKGMMNLFTGPFSSNTSLQAFHIPSSCRKAKLLRGVPGMSGTKKRIYEVDISDVIDKVEPKWWTVER